MHPAELFIDPHARLVVMGGPLVLQFLVNCGYCDDTFPARLTVSASTVAGGIVVPVMALRISLNNSSSKTGESQEGESEMGVKGVNQRMTLIRLRGVLNSYKND